MKPSVHVTVGMIASGKSTYTTNAAKAGFVVVNDDSLVTAVHGGDYGLYDKSLKPVYKSVGISILTHALSLGRSVVVDTGSRNRTTRARWVSLAKALDVPIYAITFPVEEPEVHAKRRWEADARGYTYEKWLEVAIRHSEEFEPVNDDEGFNNILFAEWEKVEDGWYFGKPVNYTGGYYV